MKRQIFYSFHYKNDVFRVQQIRNIGSLEDNKPVSVNDWETVKRAGDQAIKKWINDNMEYRSCVVVLIGEETASRRWVQYEIEHAWNTGKALIGIYIHNLKDPRNGKSEKGENPFSNYYVGNTCMADIIPVFNPNSTDAYNDIRNNMAEWVEEGINVRKKYS